MGNVMITMAGMGKRFRDAGYNVPKYRISAHGRTLFAWSMLSLRSFIERGAAFTFIVRREDNADDFIRAECAAAGIASVRIVEIDYLTDGQATSALLGGKEMALPAAPFFVYNIDTFVHPDAIPANAVHGAGWVPCFPGKGEGWSFAAADAAGRISDIREKVRISEHATIGLYGFSSFALFRQVYETHYSNPSNIEKGEKYIAPMYRQMIADGHEVFLHEVPYDAVIPLGTPNEVSAFLAKDAPVV